MYIYMYMYHGFSGRFKSGKRANDPDPMNPVFPTLALRFFRAFGNRSVA